MIATPEAYEPEAVAETRAWFADSKKDVYVVGPLLPNASDPKAIEGEHKQSQDASEIQKFLDKTLESHGAKSLVYVSI